VSFILGWGSSSLLLLHKFEIFAHCADFGSWDFWVLHKLGDFRNVVFFFLHISLNFGWGIGMMMASLKNNQKNYLSENEKEVRSERDNLFTFM
jgi:hypothetical protein